MIAAVTGPSLGSLAERRRRVEEVDLGRAEARHR